MGLTKKGPEGASRAERKAKKRKLEDKIPDLPEDESTLDQADTDAPKKKRKWNNAEADNEDTLVISEKDKKMDKKRKKSLGEDAAEGAEKISKRPKKGKTEGPVGEVVEEPEAAECEEAPRKSKKERKAERKALKAAAKDSGHVEEASNPATALETEDSTAAVEEKKARKNNRNREKKRNAAAETGDTAAKKPDRFIVFVGNLPFSATTKSIEQHFIKLKPKSVRHLTEKDDPSKSRGTAFVEFDGYDHMKTCLKVMHHSTFDDGISPARKINVELTVGGGGNTKERKSKIVGKNQKLNEERLRKAKEEAKAKLKGSGKKSEAGIDESSIHPSRRRNVPEA